MALRMRRNGVIVCAAQFPARKGDTYISDREHYEMAQGGSIETKDAEVWSYISKEKEEEK